MRPVDCIFVFMFIKNYFYCFASSLCILQNIEILKNVHSDVMVQNRTYVDTAFFIHSVCMHYA